MPSQHKEGSRNEKREMKETADPKSQGSGYFWSGRGWVMIGERGGGRAVFWFFALGNGCMGVHGKIPH